MIGKYIGHFLYNSINVSASAPKLQGVYYCGGLNPQNQLVPLYIGRAKGIVVTINSRLCDHLRNDNWPEVTHFGYVTCSTDQEAEALEAAEINTYKPRYNTIGK